MEGVAATGGGVEHRPLGFESGLFFGGCFAVTPFAAALCATSHRVCLVLRNGGARAGAAVSATRRAEAPLKSGGTHDEQSVPPGRWNTTGDMVHAYVAMLERHLNAMIF